MNADGASPGLLAAHSRGSARKAITSTTPVGVRGGEGALGFSVAVCTHPDLGLFCSVLRQPFPAHQGKICDCALAASLTKGLPVLPGTWFVLLGLASSVAPFWRSQLPAAEGGRFPKS